MRLRGPVPILTALALALPAAACAPAATAGGSPSAQAEANAANRVAVQVRNTVVPPTALTVYAVDSGGGTRRILGNVSPNGRATLSFNPAASVSMYRLMARTTGGQELLSTPFTARVGQTFVWDVQLNSIREL
ncbi:MAG TPA: hypothetical protein VFQ76_10845 [Longimicrobiaceae bacterium]|nr:hypothetical protein [Longimicrobiaceae bacterium]